MDTPNFLFKQFLSSTFLNTEFAAFAQSIAQAVGNLTGPGFINGNLITVTDTGLEVTTVFGGAVVAVFNSAGAWKLSGPFGVSSGSTSATYTTNLASFVPGSGDASVYLYATYEQIGATPAVAVGPPQQHPDWNPAASPVSGYNLNRDSIAVSAGLTLPTGALEIAVITVSSAGSIIGIWQHQAATMSLVLTLENQLFGGVVTGTANAMTVTLPINPTAYSALEGVPFVVIPGFTNTAAATMNINGLGVIPIITADGSGLAGQLVAGTPAIFMYSNGNVILANPAFIPLFNALFSEYFNASFPGSFNSAFPGAFASAFNADFPGAFAPAFAADFPPAFASYLAAAFSDQGLTASGYQELPGGLIIQWGSTTGTSGTVIDFPTEFPHACFQVVISEGNAQSSTWGSNVPTLHGVGNITQTGFNHWGLAWSGSNWEQGAVHGNFIAIGY